MCSILCDKISECMAFAYKDEEGDLGSPESECVLYTSQATALAKTAVEKSETKKQEFWSCYKKIKRPSLDDPNLKKWVGGKPPKSWSRVPFLDAKGPECPQHNGYKCRKLSLTLTIAETGLTTKRCTCFGGTPAIGIECATQGEEYCTKCDEGYELDPKQNKCRPQCSCPEGGIAAKWPQCVIPSVKCISPRFNSEVCFGAECVVSDDAKAAIDPGCEL